ncbi:MAG: hypothetical protein J6W59_05965 [Bacteroidales bacterium]|nr:hypothetical protein [Bacteroidales bacterium]
MIDIYSQVFTKLYNGLTGVKVEDEYPNALPGTFPAVTLAETRNLNDINLNDSSEREKFARLRYRVRVYSNKTTGRKSEARNIFSTADSIMWDAGFRRVAYTATPEIYNSTIYGISAEYESVVDENGVLYRNQ